MGSTLLALLAFLLIGGAASAWIYGVWLRREEAAAGVMAFAGMHWREFQRLVVAMMERRGYWRSGQDPDDGDVMLERDGRSWLLSTRHGVGYVPTVHAIGEFASGVKLSGAAGGWMTTLGQLTPEDVSLARIQKIGLLDGKTLWSEICPLLSAEQRTDIAGVLRERASRQLLVAWCVAALAGVLVFLLMRPAVPDVAATTPAPAPAHAPAVGSTPSTPAGTPDASTAPAPARTSVPASTPPIPTAPAALAQRRAQVVAAVSSLPWVERAAWASQSTLTIYLTGTDADKTEICRIVERYEELRASRLQLEARLSDRPVRFMQCRLY